MQWNIELSADKPMIFFKANRAPAYLVRGEWVVRGSAMLKIKLIDQLEQKKLKQLLVPWNNFPFLFSLHDLLVFVSLLVLKHWMSFQWSQWMFFRWMQQILVGSISAADGVWLSCCDIRSEPCYSSANPGSPCWLQGLPWIMQNNQQHDLPPSPVCGGSDVSSGSCLAGWALFALSQPHYDFTPCQGSQGLI